VLAGLDRAAVATVVVLGADVFDTIDRDFNRAARRAGGQLRLTNRDRAANSKEMTT